MKNKYRILFPLLVLAIASCDLFSTRTPEPPQGGGGGGWRFPESPGIAIENLRSAFGRRSTADYARLFVPEGEGNPLYVFSPDPGTVAANPGTFESWDLIRERKHSQAMFAPSNLPLDSLIEVQLFADRETITNDTASLTFGYNLHIGHTAVDRPRDFEGRAEFRLVRLSDGLWYIFYWGDVRATGKACWSDLKVLF